MKDICDVCHKKVKSDLYGKPLLYQRNIDPSLGEWCIDCYYDDYDSRRDI